MTGNSKYTVVAIYCLELFKTDRKYPGPHNFAMTAITQDGHCSRLELGLPVTPEILMPCEYLNLKISLFCLG